MNLENNVKNQINKKIKKIVFKIIKPYIPFILTIIGIIFAICTVADALFTTDEDMQILETMYSENYEEQYMEWLKEKELAPNTIMEGIEIGQIGMFIWPIPGYTNVTSPFGMRIHPITRTI